ncbi:hypothetical protein Tsubulata_037240 [Turnera subulata]|uniref:Mitochondrial 28S ribosomal protein S34 n=1 Tax=Turnera subulata TaxID=218843 RepID=A0A9Q0GD16_9ROSI|nr:hypothetical protein Tsubulata_037240 [Turnera subulata]
MAATSLLFKRVAALAATPNQTPTIFRGSFNSLKHLSTSAASPQTPKPDTSASKNPNLKKRKKKKNLFEVAQFLPNWGLGYHLAKSHWKNVSYEITKINLNKDGRHGKAWGIAFKDGLPAADSPKKISGVHKRCWRYIPGLRKLSENPPTLPQSTETATKGEGLAA